MSFLSKLLEYYHLTLKDLDSRKELGSFCCLERPDSESFRLVCRRILKAVANKEKIVIYGDYDVDGITATAILKYALDKMGNNAGFFIPSRYHEGYGLNEKRVREFSQKGYHLIIAVDNGVSAIDSIKTAKELGMDVLVIDHHQIPETRPDYDLLFHSSDFLSYNCSAASLCYFVASQLLGTDDQYLAFLAGLAVFSDVMPLVGNNLCFANLMLKSLKENRYLNIMTLLGDNPISFDSISFVIIPALNAVGRISNDSLSTNQVCRFLLERDDLGRIKKYCTIINSFNEQKKKMLKENNSDSMKMLTSSHAMVVESSLPSGLSGLLCNQLMNQHEKCVCVVRQSELNADEMVCSFRVPEGYSLNGMLKSKAGLFLSFGGHEKACGGTILKSKYYQMATTFISECEKYSLESNTVEKPYVDIVLEDLNTENYDIYSSFMPFGEGFERPEFHVSFEKSMVHVAQSGKVAYAESADKKGRIVLFRDFEQIPSIEEDCVTVSGCLRKTKFNSIEHIEIVAKKILKKCS